VAAGAWTAPSIARRARGSPRRDRRYRRILEVSDGLSARSIAVPAIATGVYGFPMEAAARIAVRTLLATPTDVETVRLVAFDGDARDVPASALELALADG